MDEDAVAAVLSGEAEGQDVVPFHEGDSLMRDTGYTVTEYREEHGDRTFLSRLEPAYEEEWYDDDVGFMLYVKGSEVTLEEPPEEDCFFSGILTKGMGKRAYKRGRERAYTALEDAESDDLDDMTPSDVARFAGRADSASTAVGGSGMLGSFGAAAAIDPVFIQWMILFGLTWMETHNIPEGYVQGLEDGIKERRIEADIEERADTIEEELGDYHVHEVDTDPF